jgi:phosphoribosylamine--glycine ligase
MGEMERVLILGSGGREHALAWKLLQSPQVEKVFVAPGNPGMELTPGIEVVNLPDFAEMAKFAFQQEVAFTLVGPEVLLGEGVVDYFQERGLAIFGPTKAAAQLEISKEFAKNIMQKQAVPTARHSAWTNEAEALIYVRQLFSEGSEGGEGRESISCVVKADGPMAGKGVFVCDRLDQAEEAIELLMGNGDGNGNENGNENGNKKETQAPIKVLIEEKLEGEEVSAFYLCHGTDYSFLGHACDYKRLFDGQQGPNTGGMGAYAPVSWVTPVESQLIEISVVRPVLEEMALGQKTPFSGVLFVGLMMTKDGPKVLEFNTRFGDPETQALMPLLAGDLFPVLRNIAEGRSATKLSLHPDQSVVHVVMTVEGYAQEGKTLRSGDAIQVAAELSRYNSNSVKHQEGTTLFWGGVAGNKEALQTKGGRILGISGKAADLATARELAYAALAQVNFEGAHFRKDIGQIDLLQIEMQAQVQTQTEHHNQVEQMIAEVMK